MFLAVKLSRIKQFIERSFSVGACQRSHPPLYRYAAFYVLQSAFRRNFLKNSIIDPAFPKRRPQSISVQRKKHCWRKGEKLWNI